MIKPADNLITMLEPDSPAAEAFRTLRTNLTLRDFDKKLKVINVISTNAQESKSTTVLNLAYVYSQLGKKVLVIDLDLRLPSIHKKLNLRNKNGLSDILSGQVSITEPAFFDFSVRKTKKYTGEKMNIQLSDHFNYRKLLRITLPCIIMMVFTSIYGVVDGFFVSNFVGKTPFTAVNFIMPFLMILGSAGFMFGTGGGALIAKTIGEGRLEKAKHLFSLSDLPIIICTPKVSNFWGAY
ncbi:MAG: MATE family efflux transporter, partial [Erysipelotrichaceae bacterium]